MMDPRAPRNWVAVASAEHVRRGVAGGFMQVCHGKATPLRRVHAGDHVTYYSPTETFRGTDRIQSFTAIGTVRPGEIYYADMGGGFCPARRDVDWFRARPVAIRPLLERLHFTAGKTNWGQPFRYGLFAIDDADWRTIFAAMMDTAAAA